MKPERSYCAIPADAAAAMSLSLLIRSLLTLAALLAVADAAREQVFFGTNSKHVVRLNEVTLGNEGGSIKVKNYCPSSVPIGEQVIASNSYYDRTPYIEGTILSLSVTCRALGPLSTCKDPIKVNITQYC